MGMRNKNIYVMQPYMPFTHSNNNNNYYNIHNNKKFKPTHKAKPQPLTLEFRLAYQAQSKPQTSSNRCSII
ncbi:hypothetical protein GQ457_12G018200 [Hibiscus cannabinus]